MATDPTRGPDDQQESEEERSEELHWLGENIRHLAKLNGFTLGQVAGLAGYGERTLHRWLNDPDANPELKPLVVEQDLGDA